jgi:basic amino acid/polyamine antiporter, APA family
MAPMLRRELRLLDAIGIGLGAIIGAGIFVVIGVAADVAGPGMLLGLALAALTAVPNALNSAQLAARYPVSGGTYEYGYELLGPWWGFAAGWTFLVSKLAAGSAVALGFGAYAAGWVDGAGPIPIAIGVTALLVVANLLGIRKAGALNLAIVSVTLIALVYCCLSLAPAIQSQHFQPFAPEGPGSVLQAAAIMFFAFTGYARLATLGEEVHQPERTIPRAIIWSLAVAALLYLLVATFALGAAGPAAIAGNSAPLETASRAGVLPFTNLLVSIGAGTAMLGVLLSQILGISRMMLAMSRRGDLPRALERVNSRAVPALAIVLTGALVAGLALIGRIEIVVSAASFSILLYYAIANAAAWRLPAEHRLFPRWLPALGLILCLTLALSLSLPIVLSGLGILAIGMALRLLFRR